MLVRRKGEADRIAPRVLEDAFLFFGCKRDELKLFFRDDCGGNELRKWMTRGGFLLPAPNEGETSARMYRVLSSSPSGLTGSKLPLDLLVVGSTPTRPTIYFSVNSNV
jgi:hypothetical protein